MKKNFIGCKSTLYLFILILSIILLLIGQVNADESLKIKDYLEFGVPSPDRTWTSTEMATTAQILNTLKEKHPKSLPRYGSNKSGSLFDRIVSDDNLKQLKDTSIPIEIRGPESANYMEALNQVISIYYTSFLAYQVDGAEVIELNGALLKITAIVLRNNNDFLATFDESNPNFVNVEQAINRMKEGYSKIVFGAIGKLKHKDIFGASNLIKLIQYMSQTFPDIFAMLSSNNKKEAIKSLSSIKTDPTYSAFKPSITELLKKLS